MARSVSQFQTIQCVISHPFTGIALVPSIKVCEIKVALSRYDGIGDRTLQSFCARKRIYVSLVDLSLALDFVLLNGFEAGTERRRYSLVAKYRSEEHTS